MATPDIRKAELAEYENIKDFYYTLIDDMQNMEYHPKWQKGVYPAESELKKALEHEELYIAEEAGNILSAMRVNHDATEGYENARWLVDAKDSEVTIIHMLGVSFAAQRTGVAKEMVRFVIDNARENGQKAIRLDVLEGNLPALRLYESLGFYAVANVELFYEDTGVTNFILYEYDIETVYEFGY